MGRLKQAKGIDVLLRAIQIIAKTYKDIKAAIVGGGSLGKDLKSLARHLNIQGNVQFLGIRNNVSNLMKKSKIFVLPSNWEGLPMVLLEAMANGIPIVSTSVVGCSRSDQKRKRRNIGSS